MATKSALLARCLARTLALAFALGLAGTSAATVTATDTRLGQHPDRTRFVIDLSESVDYRIFTLADPYRIVIDLPEIEWRIARDRAIEGSGLVKSFRYGLFRPGRSRVVLDLAEPAAIATDFLLPSDETQTVRLVLDLVPTDREIFLGSAGWPSDLALPDDDNAPPTTERPIGDDDNELVVVIDPGHGGVDPGATGPSGLIEKDVVLAMGLRLREALETTGTFRVFMTREIDIFLPLRDRVAFARDHKADLFISLHADSVRRDAVRGASIYTLSETGMDAEAEALARSENAADVIAGVDLTGEGNEVSNILIDLAQRETKNLSVSFAQLLIPELEAHTPLLREPHRFAGFRVLKAPDVPSVLIELGFLSNMDDEQSLQSEDWQSGVADAMVRAAQSYFDRRAAELLGPTDIGGPATTDGATTDDATTDDTVTR